MNTHQLIDSFQLYNHKVINKKIKTVAAIQAYSAIDNRERFLPFNLPAMLLDKFKSHTRLISRF